jgi:hypothetical protein
VPAVSHSQPRGNGVACEGRTRAFEAVCR